LNPPNPPVSLKELLTFGDGRLIRISRRFLTLKILTILVLAGAAFLALATGIVIVQRSRALTLSAPARPFPVGRFITTWTDHSRQEYLGGNGERPRRLSVWVWYPAEQDGTVIPYMPQDWTSARETDRCSGSFLFQSVYSIHVHATDAPLSIQGGPFPVLIFEPGLGPLIPEYTTLAEDLASRGYLVFGLNPTYSASITLLDGQVIQGSNLGTIPDDADPELVQQRGDGLVQVWATDDRFAIDESIRLNNDPDSPFFDRLDTNHIGLLGHSFGGAAALDACSLDPRCTSAADLDGWPFGDVIRTGLDRPIMPILSEQGENADQPVEDRANEELTEILAQAPEGYRLLVHGARHFNFTDYAVGFNPVMQVFGLLGDIGGVRALRITSDYLAAFFDHTLRGQTSPLLQGSSDDNPEVQLTSH
jgi:pimeloyl-ACP methyl ester carboxylesterase